MTGRGSTFTTVVLPFIVFTAIWGSTWIVIRDQLGSVAPQWSVAYRFIIAAVAMAMVARWKGERLPLTRGALAAVLVLAVSQFCINFNSVYLAEQFITSGLVATFFALLLIPNTLLAWLFLEQRPTGRFVVSSLVAVIGISLLFLHELQENPARWGAIFVGLGFALLGMLGASVANVFQAIERVRGYPFYALLAWSMAVGALLDIALAFAIAGPPTIETRPGYWAGLLYLALAASALTFSLYFPVVRRIGPAKAAYSSVLVPIIAMALSTWFEGYRWTPLAAAGVTLALGGMVGALSRPRSVVPAPDAA